MASTASIPSRSSPTELIVGHRYRLGKKIGAGSFGDIYVGVSLATGEEVAVKLEKKGARHPQLEHEMQVYMHIKGGPGIPFIRWYGSVGDSFALVMDLLGPTIQELFEYCSFRFTLKTVLMLADQMIARVDYLHRKNFIHRDLKPENFLMGMGSQGNHVFLVDYGLAKRFRDMTTFLHIPERQDKQLCGTARYASRNAHFRETSRRDDMESLGFIFLYFLRGSLPWQGLKAANQKQKYEKISSVKMSTSVEELCKNHPLEFMMYLNYCRRLHFEEIPDYDYIRSLFRNLMLSLSHQYDQIYDWMLLKRKLVAKSN